MRIVTAALMLCGAELLTGSSLSIVYNLRVAETTKRNILGLTSEQTSAHSTLSALGFWQCRKRYNGLQNQAGGLLGTYLWVNATNDIYIRTVGAIGHISSNIFTTNPTRTQTDDILTTIGYTVFHTHGLACTLSGHLGIPTHKDTSLFLPQFGIGHYALGAQGDIAYGYTDHQALNGALRCIHFFPRNACGQLLSGIRSTWNVAVGDLIDLFCSHTTTYANYSYEFGYNPSFLVNSGTMPAIPAICGQTNFQRQAFYAAYYRNFSIAGHASGIGVGFSYGFDTHPKVIGNQRIITTWATWGITF